MPFKFGVMQNVLGEPLETVFAAAREDGFDGVELDWNSADQMLEGGSLAPENRAAILAAAHEAGVEIHAVCAHFHNSGGLASADEEVYKRALETIRDGLYASRQLGASALLVPFFGTGETDLSDKAGQERLVSALQVLAGDAAKAGVFIALESTLRGDVAARLIDATRSTHIGAYWDMANCMSLGYDPIQEVRSLGTRIVRVHAKEFSRSPDASAQRSPGSYSGLNKVALGEGDVPIREVLAELKSVGYRGYVTLETGAFGDKRASARVARQVLAEAASGL